VWHFAVVESVADPTCCGDALLPPTCCACAWWIELGEEVFALHGSSEKSSSSLNLGSWVFLTSSACLAREKATVR